MIRGMWASMFLVMKRLGFSRREIMRTTLKEFELWMRAIEIENESKSK